MTQFGPYESSSSDKKYWVTLSDDGKLGCPCRGWTIRRGEKPRSCSHTDDVVKKQKFLVETRGEFIYVIGNDGDDPILPGLEAEPQNENGKMDDFAKATADGFVSPMLASAMKDDRSIEDYADWVLEEKYNGHRVIVAVHHGGKVLAWSRPKGKKVGNKRDIPSHIVQALAVFPPGTYDGELIVSGVSTNYKVTDLSLDHSKQLAIFDVVRVLDQDVCDKPYHERRAMLELVFDRLGSDGPVILAETHPVSLDKVKEIWDRNGEGAILKDPDGRYRRGYRTPDWVKIKKAEPATLEVVGFEKGKNGPYSKVMLVDRKSGIETSVKTKNNAWLREFAANADAYIGRMMVVRHFGRTPKKFQGPILWDHWAGDGEK